MDKCREEFERWYESSVGASKLEWLDELGCYNYASTSSMWRAWQASRAAIKVELPDERVDSDWEPYFDIDEIKTALSKAGITYD